MATVQIGFSYRPGNVLSWLIRTVSGAKCSHAWLLIDDPYFGVPVVLQASTEGFTLCAYSDFQKANDTVQLVTPSIDLGPAVHRSWKELGEGYDYPGLLGMSWVMLGRALHRKWKNPLASSDAMFCSEAVVRVLQVANYPGAAALVPQDTGPEDLLKFLQQ